MNYKNLFDSTKKKIIWIISFFILIIAIAVPIYIANKPMTDLQYDAKVQELNLSFDDALPDFYQQCILSSNGEVTDKDLFSLYSKNLGKLYNFYGIDNKKFIPKDKITDWNEKHELADIMFNIQSITLLKEQISSEYCDIIIKYSEKRFSELGMLDQQKKKMHKIK